MTREAPARADFNRYRDSYRDAVQDSLALPGTEVEYFVRAKADRLTELAGALGALDELDVLDVGCGGGETDRFLEGRFGSLAGVDIASELVEKAAEGNPWAGYLHYGEGEPIPHADDSFDLTFAICVLHHVEPSDRERFVAEMARVTRPGDLVAAFEHTPWNPLTRLSVHRCEFDEGVVLLTRGRTKRLLQGRGLDVEDSSYIVFFPRSGPVLDRAERRLGGLPAGAQYYVAARKPKGAR